MTFVRNAAFLLLALLLAVPARAGHHDEGPVKTAIVLAAFGTSYPEAVKSILNIKTKVEQANPGVPVRLAFTSNIIRRIWQKRQDDAAWQKAHADIPAEVLFVKHPLATIADLQNDGYRDVAVQSLHVFAGEEFTDLAALVDGLRSIHTMKAKNEPFVRLVLGRPALGMPGDARPYGEDMARAAKALKGDVDQAREMGAALVYMGHGNDFFSTGIYAEFQKVLQAEYDYPIFIGCVEGYPAFDDMTPQLKASGERKVLLKPFMIVAGDHASNDMAGDEDDSWKVMLTKQGFDVTTDLRGLGMLDGWAAIYVDHLADAMTQKPGAK
ncbi:anaerobic cobalt chelatase [Pseudodesulfovibrio mercurii]|uniref:Anaerobic cobalt chelatase n=1 Tax=Pseudodesulfovibrio mercurii TaxID=641491 RepID=F0JKX0_9BACT|nr:sirohydrochlorin cobaltochelatase [Pseudodesulfovibrio mercurii]EGB16569.1 anaerobic cobalt chelatase [Pseudodesulfovibrio mercurii]